MRGGVDKIAARSTVDKGAATRVGAAGIRVDQLYDRFRQRCQRWVGCGTAYDVAITAVRSANVARVLLSE